MKQIAILSLVLMLAGCLEPHVKMQQIDEHIVPAEAFSRAVKRGDQEDFSIFRAAHDPEEIARAKLYEAPPIAHTSAERRHGEAKLHQVSDDPFANFKERQRNGEQRYLSAGYQLQKSADVVTPATIENAQFVATVGAGAQVPSLPAGPPPGSSAPYFQGQMTHNPSLWPGDHQGGGSLFRDFRAYQPMDLITILVNEDARGKKKADTEAESQYDLLAGISHFFGIETKDWAANNTALDPSKLIQANTSSKFEGEGETNRSGSLVARISAVIMEVLPNGVLRVEGTKIISLNNEEEILVISGLIRQRDIGAENEVDSGRVANMRIDFYGRGVVADKQSPGWGARIFDLIWPF